MNSHPAQVLSSAILKLLRPLVRILLRNGVPFKSFAELAKQTYVEVARDEFVIKGKKQTVSRISILTGLTRKEVKQLVKPVQADHSVATDRYNRAARVIAGWVRDADFQGKKGQPAPLPLEGSRKSFTELVRRYSGDIPSRAILDEFQRVGVVKRLKDGRICLLARSYVPQRSSTDKLAILGTDVSDLIATIEHNLEHGATEPRFQRKVMYDNLPAEAAEQFQGLSAKRAQTLIEAMDHWLARRDRDVNPAVRGKGRVRAGIGIYFFKETVRSKEKENTK